MHKAALKEKVVEYLGDDAVLDRGYFSDGDLLASTLTSIGDSTNAGRLGPDASMMITRIAHLFSCAIDSFGETTDATRFMLTPHPELRGIAPLDAAFTVSGARTVESVIQRGLHGMPA